MPPPGAAGTAFRPLDGTARVAQRLWRMVESAVQESWAVVEAGGERLRLRPLQSGDVDDLFALYGSPEVTRFWSFGTWTTRAQAEAWLAERLPWGPPSVYPWAVADRRDEGAIKPLIELLKKKGYEKFL